MRALFLLLTLPLIFTCRTTDQSDEAKQDHLCEELSRIETEYGARIGLFFLDTETGETAAYRADERFAFCSTFKAFAAGFFLLEADESRMNERVFFTEDDILSWAPVCRTKTETGMTAAEICEAAIRFSDNTAANLLFDLLGGPEGLTRRLNALGDRVTLSVRREPYLNEFLPGKPDDTTTPEQAVRTLCALCGELETAGGGKLTRFLDWMSGNDTGKTLIRAGAPPEWQTADKSGSGSYGTRNDIAVLRRPGRKPLYAAVFTRKEEASALPDDRAVSEAAAAVFGAGFAEQEDEEIHSQAVSAENCGWQMSPSNQTHSPSETVYTGDEIGYNET